MRVSFNWLKDYVALRISPQDLAEKLTMAGLEVTSLSRIDHDTIMEIEVTPNRTDCLNIVGIAREAAAICGKKLKAPKIGFFRGKSGIKIPVQIQDKKRCLRYSARVIKNVEVRPSPEWLIQRLEAMGIHAVNNIVDITNFCLLESGQPLHAFDLDKLQGPRIIVRRAAKEEEIITIDGVRRRLEPDMLVIADRQAPVAIAGIMGGKDSEVGESTTNILLESAYFDPINIHNTSRKLGLASQSSYRFERGVDLEGVLSGSLRATELIQRLARPAKRTARPIAIGKLVDKGTRARPANRVRLRFARLNATLGLEVPKADVKDILHRLKLLLVRRCKESVTVDVPGFRPDISREADLIEEVARLFGYDKVPLDVSCLAPNLSHSGERRLASGQIYDAVRRILSSCGFNEIMTYSLLSRHSIRKLELPLDNIFAIRNPLSYEQEVLRPSLLSGMLNVMLTNINRKNTNLKLFELSRVYLKTDKRAPGEPVRLCMAITGKAGENWLRRQNELSFFDLKGTLATLLDKLGVENFRFTQGQSPLFITGRCANVMLGEESLGLLGELKHQILKRFDIASAVYAGEFNLQGLLACVRHKPKFSPLLRFPAIERDISLIAPPEVTSGEIVSLINEIGREYITRIRLFDQYFGEQIPAGFRGLSYSIEYRSPERTLTAEEVDKLHKEIRQALTERLKVQLR